MKTVSYEKVIADRQRRSIKKVMFDRHLKVAPWCEDAGISEGTLRNFLAGESNSITTVNAQKLADKAFVSISELLCGTTYGSTKIAGYIINGAKIIREDSEPTAKEISMLIGAELSPSADKFRIRMDTPSIDEGTIVVFDNEISEGFERYFGKKVLVKLRSGEEFVKVLYKGTEPGKYNLQAYGIAGDHSALMENVAISHCALLKQIIVA